MNKLYKQQVELLLKIIPSLSGIDSFAVHGGTAINLYGGKISAALDRQHPRDLFDVRNT